MTEPYQDVLASAGFPTDILVLDWETFFDKNYSLKKKDTHHVDFVADPRFETLGLGVQRFGRDLEPFFAKVDEAPGTIEQQVSIYGPNLERCTVVGHNLYFDALILREKYGITPKYTVDTMDLSRHLDARDRHSLAHLAEKYGCPTAKGDTMQFLGLHARDMSSEQWAAMSEYCCDDIRITAFLVKKLLPMITRPEKELRLAAQTLRMFLVPNIEVDTNLGNKLAADMGRAVDGAIEATRKYGIVSYQPPKITKRTSKPPVIRQIIQEDISKDGLFVNLLNEALPGDETVPMKQGKLKMIPALAKTDDAVTYLLEHPEPAVRALMEARQAISSWPGHIKKVRRIMSQAACRGGLLGIPLKYCGAGPGRWSGAGGINAQNFGARNVHQLIKQVGGMLMARRGYLMGSGDLSQIEARVIAWLAGQTDLLGQYARGEDVYSIFAQNHIFHEETRKPREGDSPELVKQLVMRRNFGKEVELACGFSMSGNTFYTRCRQNPLLRPLFDAGTYDKVFCIKLVKLYRATHKKIVSFWGELERAFRFVTKYKDQVTTVKHNGNALIFFNHNDTTVIQLPSGRCMFYPHARVSARGGLSYKSGPRTYDTYGGKIAENATQATARDVFSDGLLRLEDAGFTNLFSVHDQALTLIRDDSGAQDKLAEMHALQVVIPEWATGLPVATEGTLRRRFKE
ncbi:MAG: hypothetical protein GQ565_03015 [Candidatus Aegiribacteria sp.]|nr:hypothetical protein [Candidatus Aegiribacteria sp.]